jgi:hypothetical protein
VSAAAVEAARAHIHPLAYCLGRLQDRDHIRLSLPLYNFVTFSRRIYNLKISLKKATRKKVILIKFSVLYKKGINYFANEMRLFKICFLEPIA